MSNELKDPNQEQEMGNTQKNNMFINLVSGRPASVAKALRFGLNFLKAGWDVALLLNIDGVQVINPVMEIGLCPVTGQPLPEMLEDFRDQGGRVLAGKECLDQARIKPEGVPDWIEIATFPLLEELMSRPGIRTMTW